MLGGTISWTSSGGGDWGAVSSWSSGAAPDASTDVLDALPGLVTITSGGTARSLTINNAGGTVEVEFSTLALSGMLNVAAGAFVLDGALTGGTIAATGGSFLIGGFYSTVSNVTYEGTLTLGVFQYLTIDGITLLGAGGTGAGTLAVTQGQAVFGVTQTLAAGTIALGSPVPGSQPSVSVSQGATLSLGAQALVQTAGHAAVISGTVVNAGTIAAQVAGDTLSISGALLNQGLLTVSQGDDVVIGPGTTLANTGTIIVASGGTLDLWGTLANTGSINATGGTILADGAVSLAELHALKAAGAVLVLAGTLDNSGAVLQVGSSASLGTLALAGTIRNGTIQDSGGGLVLNGGTLDGVTYQGALGVGTSPYYSNTILDGLTVGGGPIAITGGLLFGNTETIVAGTINLGGPAGPAWFAAGAGATVTFAAGDDTEQTGATVGIGGSYSGGSFASSQGGQVFNSLGTLDAGFAGGVMTLGYGTELINRGLMEVRNGATFLAQGTLLNAGTLAIASGGTLEVTGGSLWANTGTVRGAGGSVLLTGPITDAEVTSFAGSGAVLLVEGVVDNSIGTLAIGGGSALGSLTLGPGGAIRGGTIRDGGGGLIGSTGTLDGVTYQGTLGLIHPNDLLTITDGITMTGTSGPGGTIAVTGNGATLAFANGQTLSAAVVIGAASAEADITTGGPGATLTLGSAASITQTGGLAGLVANGGTIVNQGTILATLPGGRFNLAASGGVLLNSGTIDVANMDVATVGSLVNAGQVTVAAGAALTVGQYTVASGGTLTESGATLNLGGALSLAALASLNRSGGIVAVDGTLGLGGNTLTVGGGTALNQLRNLGTVANGTIADTGGGMVYYGGTGTLQNVTYRGLVNLTPALSNLIVQNLTATAASGTGAGAVNLLGAGSTLTFLGSQVFTNATINFGSNIQADVIAVRDPTGTGAVLTLGATANLQQRGTLAEIVIDRGLGDGLVNNGLIAANQPGGNLIVLGGTFTNGGRVVVSTGDTMSLQADQVTNLYGNVLGGGYWEIDANSTLNLGMDDPIMNINAAMVLNGPGSQVLYYDTTKYQTMSIEQSVNYIGASGVLVLQNGRSFNDPGLLFVNGQVVLSNGAVSGKPIAIASTGIIYGSGTVSASAIYDSGHVLAQNGALTVNAQLLGGSPVGNALIGAGATLVANQTVAIPTQFLGTTGTLALGQPSTMYGMIYSFTGADAIDLINVGTAGVSLSYAAGAGNGVLTVKNGATAVANLHFNGNYVLGNFRTASDGHGGTLILDPPVPAASPDWQVTLADFTAPPTTAATGSASSAGTIAGSGAIILPADTAPAVTLLHP